MSLGVELWKITKEQSESSSVSEVLMDIPGFTIKTNGETRVENHE